MYLAARAFQQAKDAQLDGTKYPTYEEARWQVDMLIQYNLTNCKQRQRDFQLITSLSTRLLPNSFFKHTFVPPFNSANKFYGNTGKHSMLVNMPYPKARMVGEVSVVGPKAIIGYVLANGIPIDDVIVRHPLLRDTGCSTPSGHHRCVQTVDQCRKTVELVRKVEEQYYGMHGSTDGPDLNPNEFKAPAVVCMVVSD